MASCLNTLCRRGAYVGVFVCRGAVVRDSSNSLLFTLTLRVSRSHTVEQP